MSEIADDSAARVDSVGAPPKARRRDAGPAAGIGITSSHERGHNQSASMVTIGISIEEQGTWAATGVAVIRQAGGHLAVTASRASDMSASAIAGAVATNNRRFGIREPTPAGVHCVP
jgi:hypothetical protein